MNKYAALEEWYLGLKTEDSEKNLSNCNFVYYKFHIDYFLFFQPTL